MLSPDLAPNPAGTFIPPWPTHPGKGLGFLFKAAAALGQTLHRPGAEGIAFGWCLDPVLLCKLLLAGGAMLGTRVPHAAANVKLREDDGLSLLLHCGWIPCSKGAPWDTPQPPAWGCSTHPLHPSPPSSEGTASSGAGCCCQDFTPSALGRDLTKLRGGGGRPWGVPPHPCLCVFSSCGRLSTARGDTGTCGAARGADSGDPGPCRSPLVTPQAEPAGAVPGLAGAKLLPADALSFGGSGRAALPPGMGTSLSP